MRDLPIEDAENLLAQDDHAGTESAYDLKRLMSALPDKMRRAIQMVKLDGLTVAEAANRSGVSESDIKISVYRGLKSLVGKLARRGNR